MIPPTASQPPGLPSLQPQHISDHKASHNTLNTVLLQDFSHQTMTTVNFNGTRLTVKVLPRCRAPSVASHAQRGRLTSQRISSWVATAPLREDGPCLQIPDLQGKLDLLFCLLPGSTNVEKPIYLAYHPCFLAAARPTVSPFGLVAHRLTSLGCTFLPCFTFCECPTYPSSNEV